MRLTPPSEEAEDPGPVLEGLHPRHRPGVPQAHDRAARGLHRPDLRGAVRRRPLRRRAPGRDHRRGPAPTRSSRTTWSPSPPCRRRASLGANRLLQPGRAQGSARPPPSPATRPPTAPAGTTIAPSTPGRSGRCSGRSTSSVASAAPRLCPTSSSSTPRPISTSGSIRRRWTTRASAGSATLAQPRIERPDDRRRVAASSRSRARTARSSTSASARSARPTSS